MKSRIERAVVNRYARSAFTLIEMLLVLVILSALAAVLVPRLAGRAEQARVTAAETDIRNLGLALDAFEIDVGRYPTTEENLDALLEEPPGVTGWRQPYVSSRSGLLDPWGNPYIYSYPGQFNRYGYDLNSFGPDGREGTDDDIANW